MPRLKKSESQEREAAFWAAIAERAARRGLKTDIEIASAIGMSDSAYYRRKADPFGRFSLCEVVRMNRVLGISAAQCLEYMGYKGVKVLEE